jgi:hypothetical protein
MNTIITEEPKESSNHFISYDENSKQIIELKYLRSNTISLEEKYQIALNYLKELQEKCRKQSNY